MIMISIGRLLHTFDPVDELEEHESCLEGGRAGVGVWLEEGLAGAGVWFDGIVGAGVGVWFDGIVGAGVGVWLEEVKQGDVSERLGLGALLLLVKSS